MIRVHYNDEIKWIKDPVGSPLSLTMRRSKLYKDVEELQKAIKDGKQSPDILYADILS